MIIYYNSECSKCNEALGILEGNTCDFEIREYLKIPPAVGELRELVKLLKCRPIDLVRQKEQLFIDNYQGKEISDEEWLKILSQYPVLIERPIVIDGERAIIGRPPSLVLELIRDHLS